MNDLNSLINEYMELAISTGKAIVDPDNKTLRRNEKKEKQLLVRLRSLGETAHQSLVSLLEHENEYVRFSAAYNLIKIDSEKSIEVLQQIVENSAKSFLSGHAEMALDIFKNTPDKIPDDFQFWTIIREI